MDGREMHTFELFSVKVSISLRFPFDKLCQNLECFHREHNKNLTTKSTYCPQN